MTYETLPRIDFGPRGTVTVAANPEGVANLAVQRFATALTSSVIERGSAYFALSGGSTPKRMGELLAFSNFPDPSAWERLHVFWGDERWAPLESEESNAGVALRTFLNAVPVPPGQIHPMADLSLTEQEAADRYEEIVRRAVPTNGGTPVFDLVFLGMGDDGHTASLFPGTPAIHERDRLVVANFVPELDATRLTMTPRLLNAAREVVFLVTGAGKAERLAQVVEGPRAIDVLPAQVIQPVDGSLTWLVDEAAALALTGVRADG